MNNKLLTTIKENNREIDKTFPTINSHGYPLRNIIQSHITKFRIKELEALIEIIENEIQNERYSGAPYLGNKIIQILKDTIKELK